MSSDALYYQLNVKDSYNIEEIRQLLLGFRKYGCHHEPACIESECDHISEKLVSDGVAGQADRRSIQNSILREVRLRTLHTSVYPHLRYELML